MIWWQVVGPPELQQGLSGDQRCWRPDTHHGRGAGKIFTRYQVLWESKGEFWELRPSRYLTRLSNSRHITVIRTPWDIWSEWRLKLTDVITRKSVFFWQAHVNCELCSAATWVASSTWSGRTSTLLQRMLKQGLFVMLKGAHADNN